MRGLTVLALVLAASLSSSPAAPVPTHLMPKPIRVLDPGPGPDDPGVYPDLYGRLVFWDQGRNEITECRQQRPVVAFEWPERPKKPLVGGGWVRDKWGVWTFHPTRGP